MGRSRRSKAGRAGAAALLAGSLATVASAQAGAQQAEELTPDPRANSDAATRIDAAASPGRRNLVGMRTEDGSCRYTLVGSGNGLRQSEPLVIKERAEDPLTCTSTVDVFTDPLSKASPVTPSLGSSPSRAARPQADCFKFSACASVKLNYEDPPQADVTTARANVAWNSNGSCNTDYTTDGSFTDEFQQTGWYREYRVQDSYKNCAEAVKGYAVRWGNEAFSLAQGPLSPCYYSPYVFVEYDAVYMSGKSNYTYEYYLDHHKGGGPCNNLLHSETIVGG